MAATRVGTEKADARAIRRTDAAEGGASLLSMHETLKVSVGDARGRIGSDHTICNGEPEMDAIEPRLGWLIDVLTSSR
jgi:hypothetical protein